MNFTIPNSAGYEERDLAEYNTCHAPGSGEFCAGGRGADAHGFGAGKGTASLASRRGKALPDHPDAPKRSAFTVQGKLDRPSSDAKGFSAGKPSANRAARIEQALVNGRGGRAPGQHATGSQAITSHRGIEIHTLPGYLTPYYYAKHPRLGSMEHSASLRRVKNTINTLLDQGLTPKGVRREKRIRSRGR